jgi:hypothetical protein
LDVGTIGDANWVGDVGTIGDASWVGDGGRALVEVVSPVGWVGKRVRLIGWWCGDRRLRFCDGWAGADQGAGGADGGATVFHCEKMSFRVESSNTFFFFGLGDSDALIVPARR